MLWNILNLLSFASDVLFVSSAEHFDFLVASRIQLDQYIESWKLKAILKLRRNHLNFPYDTWNILLCSFVM